MPTLAFTDETGNSGMNMFDPGQPYFWTGTLLTPTDWDSLPAEIHAACLERAGCHELHGNQLGLGGIERIATRLRQLLVRYRSSFVFTRIEKKHLVALKFVDTLMDSGLNDAVSNFHYGIRVNRLYLAHVLEAMLNHADRVEFWDAYATSNSRRFASILRRIEGRIETYVNDKRTKQLLMDAIEWGKAHPELLLDGTRSPLDSPNVLALTLLVHELHRINDRHGLTIQTFIHDEQQQFGKYLKDAFELSKRFSNVRSTSPLAELVNIKEMTTFECEFRQAKSKTSFGLQVLDVALWLTKRFTDDPDSVGGSCRDLAKHIDACSFVSHFSQATMTREVEDLFTRMADSPLTPEMERKGKEIRDKLEAARVERMRATITEKIPPRQSELQSL